MSQDRSDVGQEGCRTGDEGKDGCRKGGMRERRDAGKE